jgi:hypothetical protein
MRYCKGPATAGLVQGVDVAPDSTVRIAPFTWLCPASRDGNDASDPLEHDKPGIGSAVSMIA